jgi:hypothetical protein
MDKIEVIEYDGANFKSVSEPIQEYLDLINKYETRAIHVKKKNQVWFCSNPYILVYDYELNAWTIFDNIAIDQRSTAEVLPYGATIRDVTWWETGASYHNLVRFNDTLNTDQGSTITLLAKTRFHKKLGDSVQEEFRRLYVDVDTVGSTQGVTINFYPNYGTSVYLTRNTYLDAFNKRLDFGISAKSLSVELIMRASQAIRINGYTIESRFLRKT